MGSAMSNYTTALANSLCGGSSRKLIAGWWYSILAVTAILTLLSFVIMSTRSMAEGFTAIWSAVMLFILSIGGTMIMRKFHNSMAVGFFMGGVVAMSQFFFLLFLIMVQCILLGSFAAILGAHRSEILDKNREQSTKYSSPGASYEPPAHSS